MDTFASKIQAEYMVIDNPWTILLASWCEVFLLMESIITFN